METSWVSHRSARSKVFRKFGFGDFGQMSWLLFPCSQSISYAYFIISSRVLGREPICQSVISLRYAGACHYLALPSFIMGFCSFFCLSLFFFFFFTFQLEFIGLGFFFFFFKVSLTFFFAHLTRWPLATMQSRNQLKTIHGFPKPHTTPLHLHHGVRLFSLRHCILFTEQVTPSFSFPKLPEGVESTLY